MWVAPVKQAGDVIALDIAKSRWAVKELGPSENGMPQSTQTRWAIVPSDFDEMKNAANACERTMLAVALGEVGTYEEGDESQKRRIVSYWNSMAPLGQTPVTIQNINRMPWGGAFVDWTVARANLPIRREATIAAG